MIEINNWGMNQCPYILGDESNECMEIASFEFFFLKKGEKNNLMGHYYLSKLNYYERL